MDAQRLIDQLRDVVGGKLVYGEPFERNGVAVIPAARVRAGGGGGGGLDDAGERGGGGGGGLVASPAGAWVVSGGDVRWKPAIDLRHVAAMTLALTILIRFGLRRRR